MDLTFGQLIGKFEESLRAQLMQLENSYEPCDSDTANIYLNLVDKYIENLSGR